MCKVGKAGGRYAVKGKNGKRLSKPTTKAKAQAQARAIHASRNR